MICCHHPPLDHVHLDGHRVCLLCDAGAGCTTIAEVVGKTTVKVNCLNCGEPLVPWFSPTMEFDEKEADELYQFWLEQKCEKCGVTPRAMGGR